MSDVELLCDKSFSGADLEIVDRFLEFQQALIEDDIDKLTVMLLDDFTFDQSPNRFLAKSELICEIEEGTLDFSKSSIMDPTVLFDDDNSASLISKVRLTAKVNGRELRWISDTVADFRKIDDIWYLAGWDN